MQFHRSKYSRQCGSVLIITLILAVILGTTLASYLYWVRTQNLLVSESQAWNSALNIAEAGIEEGMAQINVNVGTTNPLNYTNSTGAIGSANGWNGSGPYTKTNAALGYFVTVSNDYPPTIYSSATITVPLVGQVITRTVKVTTMTNSLFGVGIATMVGIDMKGNNINLDAYDSADLIHFPGGVWNATNAFAGGDIATQSGSIDIDNANIHGRLFLAPDATYTVKTPNGVVGDMPWNWPAQSGLQGPEWVFNDWNKEFADVLVPFTSGLTPPTGTYSTNSYELASGNYYVNGDFTSSKNLQVNGVASLYVTGDFSADSITIPAGCILRLYVGKLTGSASKTTFGTVNNAGNAYNIQLFGLPRMTTFTLSGNNAYMGTIYAPQCDVTLNGGGNNTIDYQGACVVKSFTSNGHFNLHYDKNLSRIGFPSGYTVSSWQEL